MCLSNISGLESAILNFYFRSGRKIFPMGELIQISKTFSTMYHKLYYLLSKIKIQGVATTPLVADVAKKSW